MAPKLQSSQLQRDKLLIEEELRRIVAEERSSNGPLIFECMSYAVLSDGKRLRPLLGMQVARALDANPTACLTYLAAVEILHTASLIIDDLPCMDNETVRRSMPAAHLQYGEGITILSAFAMVALSIRLAEIESHDASRRAVRQFRTMMLDCIGREGLIAGQAFDLTRQGSTQGRYSKTTPLFELTCAAGMICADLPLAERQRILEFGRSYGRAFQAADDFVDGDHSDDAPATSELSNCAKDLAGLRARNEGFHLLREFVDFLDTRNISMVGAAPKSGDKVRRLSAAALPAAGPSADFANGQFRVAGLRSQSSAD
jgi:geranylgeranyl diphosphate synthase type II